MPKRGGLGQRGLDLLIPNSPRQEKGSDKEKKSQKET